MCAAIDKTYLSYENYLILKEWCENTELIYDNGVKGSPKDFLYLYNEPYEGVSPVWNTPFSFDRWLYKNCPLSFIQQRLSEQYTNLNDLEESKTYEIGTHYTQITKPKYNFRYKGNWWIDIENRCQTGNWLWFGFYSETWRNDDLLLPSEPMSSSAHIPNLTKRKLNRLIKKWKLPIGTILRISNRWVGSDYKIIIRK